MYLAIVLTTMLIFPGISWVVTSLFFPPFTFSVSNLALWFVFWALGVRLFIAGLRQVFQPSFTAKQIFEISDVKSHVVIQELGFANISLGVVGLISLWMPGWIQVASLLGSLFYGLAGINHIFRHKNMTEWIAMVSDLYASALFLSIFTLTIVGFRA